MTLQTKTIRGGSFQLLGIAAAALTLGLAACEQPGILCTTGHGEYTVKYTPVSGSGPCAGLSGGTAGVQAYANGGPGELPRYAKPPLAIRPSEIGGLVDTYKQAVDPKTLQAVGTFTDKEPGADGFCRTSTLTPATVTLAAVPAMTDAMGMMTAALPAVTVTYDWSDVKFYVSAANPGTMFTAKLKYTINGCMAEYTAVGLTPAASCEKTDMDGMGTGVPDDSLCSPCADVAAGRATGSGIGPNVDTICDPKLLRCVPRSAPPSLRTADLACTPTYKPPTTPVMDAGGGMDTGGGADTAPPADGGAGDTQAQDAGAEAGTDAGADTSADTASDGAAG